MIIPNVTKITFIFCHTDLAAHGSLWERYISERDAYIKPIVTFIDDVYKCP